MHPTYTIRTADQRGIETAVKFAAAEGWNPGRHDAACFYEADPEGFLVGALGEEIVSTISAVRYGSVYGFVGLYIVTPEHRGKGLGYALWREAMHRLERIRTIGLDGVLAQQANYAKSGFAIAHRNIRYECKGGGTVPSGVLPIAKVPFDRLLAFDTQCFSTPREVFLRAWISQPDAFGYAAVDASGVYGYGIIRPCLQGYKIGPLFAESESVAATVFSALAAHASDGPLYLDVPDVNVHALALARRHSMTPCFETARMYRGPQPATPMNKIYGISTFELG